MNPMPDPTLHPTTNPGTNPGSQAVADDCLDPDALRRHLAQALGRPVHALRITQVRRTTSRQRNPHPLQLALEADLAGRPGEGWQTFHGKLCRDAAGAAALLAETATGASAAVALLLPALHLVLWAWPHDPGLPQLPGLLDPAQTLPWCGRRAQAVQVLRYTPGQRASLRYQVGTDAGQPVWLYAKTFRDDRAAAIHQRFDHFWQQAQQQADAPTVARPLGHDAATRSLWQASASGMPLPALLHSGLPWLPGQVARAWAAVHQAPLALAGPQPRDRAHWLAELARRRKKVARALPGLAPAADRLVAALQQASSRLAEPPLSLIHGDCHPDQLWLQGQRVVLFDFDEFKPGDPMEDLAEFLAKLAPDGAEAAFGRALLAAYAEAAPARLHSGRLHWHLAVQHLLQAARAYGFQRPGWPDEMAARLGRAQAAADACLAETDR